VQKQSVKEREQDTSLELELRVYVLALPPTCCVTWTNSISILDLIWNIKGLNSKASSSWKAPKLESPEGHKDQKTETT
jgi:hypothetical protein